MTTNERGSTGDGVTAYRYLRPALALPRAHSPALGFEHCVVLCVTQLTAVCSIAGDEDIVLDGEVTCGPPPTGDSSAG